MVYQSQPSVCVGTIITRIRCNETEILLIRRGKPPGLASWSVPGGHLMLGETLQEGAIRETREETGTECEIIERISLHELIEHHPDGAVKWHYIVVNFLAAWRAGQAIAASDAAQARWFTETELAGADMTAAMLDAIRQGIHRLTVLKQFTAPI